MYQEADGRLAASQTWAACQGHTDRVVVAVAGVQAQQGIRLPDQQTRQTWPKQTRHWPCHRYCWKQRMS